jgi:hypothetical protein
MTRDQLQTAIGERIPFLIKMADGEKYEVSDRDRVALGKTSAIVVGDDDMPHVLPLLTMTGISRRLLLQPFFSNRYMPSRNLE